MSIIGRVLGDAATTADLAAEVAEGLQLDRQRDRLSSGAADLGTLNAGAELASWSSERARWLIVSALAAGQGASGETPPVFRLGWSDGMFAAPPALFNQAGPIVLFANQVRLSVDSAAGLWRAWGRISPFDGGAFPEARPLFQRSSNVARNIAAAGSSWFELTPYTRRVRVSRGTFATPFTVEDVFAARYFVAANTEMPWMEISPGMAGGGFQLRVLNTGAGPDGFTVQEELAL